MLQELGKRQGEQDLGSGNRRSEEEEEVEGSRGRGTELTLTGCLLYVWHCARHFASTNTFNHHRDLDGWELVFPVYKGRI